MPTPGFTAERSLYRSPRQYRGSAPGAGRTTYHGNVVPQDLATCCYGDNCLDCPGGGCVIGPHGVGCTGPFVTEQSKPRFVMATLWPFHCTSSDETAEVYCHSGCVAGTSGAQCFGPGPWGVAEEQPVFLKG